MAAADGYSPRVEILHSGAKYLVRFLRCNEQQSAVICFEYWKPKPTLEGEFSAEGYFRHRGANAIGILAAENDWFQDDEIDEVLAAIRRATPGWRLAGYGGSMGGFAVINFAHDLGLSTLIAVVPQVSLDPMRAPFENRWPKEAARVTFRHDRIGVSPVLSYGWIVFDPWSIDGRHAAEIQQRHRLGELRVYMVGHGVMLALQQAGLYQPMLLDMLAGSFDPVAFRLGWRRARRRSAAYWLGLAQALLRRRCHAAALRAIAQARTLPHHDPAWIDLTEAEALIGLGRLSAAAALAARWLDDPSFGPPARTVLQQILPPRPEGTRATWRSRLQDWAGAKHVILRPSPECLGKHGKAKVFWFFSSEKNKTLLFLKKKKQKDF